MGRGVTIHVLAHTNNQAMDSANTINFGVRAIRYTGRCHGRQGGMVVLVFSAILLFTSACISEPGIDKGKFAELDRTIQELKAAITSSYPCDLPDNLQQKIASGIAAVKDKANSKGEHDLIVAYSHLLSTYKDGLLLCQFRTHLSNFDFFPKGRIYVSQELDPLVEKYDLSTEKHIYKRTGQYMRSIDGNSIRVIWESARIQIKNIENMMNYN